MRANDASETTPSRLTRFLAVASIGAVWLLSRPYRGATGDAIIYLGRAFADLAPETIGADIMFARDGQSRFSLFTPLYGRLVGALGPDAASFLTAALALALWLAAMAMLGRRLTQGRTLWAALICVAAMPHFYGPIFALHFGEPLAVPRPFAEAFTLIGLAWALDRRWIAALAALAFAALFHPIMAAAGFGVLYVMAVADDRRWLWLAPLGIVALAAAAVLRLPLAERLLVVIDAEWLALLRSRNAYLFPSQWPLDALVVGAAQAATLAIAASLAQGARRVFYGAVLGVGLAGVAGAALFADRWPLLLVAQAQIWRAAWLAAALAALAVAIVGVALWRRGGAFRLSLAALMLGWAPVEPALALIGSTLALTLHFGAARLGAVSPRVIGVAFAGVFALIVAGLIAGGVELAGVIAAKGEGLPYARLVKMHLHAVPVAALAVAWAARDDWRPPQAALVALTALLVLAAAMMWNRIDAPGERVESIAAPREWRRDIATKPGSVLWLDSTGQNVWLWLGRANWLADAQGAGAVFSRDQALIWRDRAQAALDAGLARDSILRPGAAETARRPTLTADGVARLCGASDRPDWIVAPLLPGATPPAGLAAAVWTSPVAENPPRRLAVVSCAAIRQARP